MTRRLVDFTSWQLILDRRRSIIPILLALAISAGACSPAPQQALPEAAALTGDEREDIEAMLLGWEDDWVRGIVERDYSILESILAPDFIYTVNNGELHGKASFIALGENDPVTTDSVEIEDVELRWYSDQVVAITGMGVFEGTDPNGDTVTTAARWTNIFVERDGQWHCVVGHSTAIDPA